MRLNELIELKEKTPLEVVEVSFHSTPRSQAGEVPKAVEFVRIRTKVFTDGEIENIGEETSQTIDEYYFGKKKYEPKVDTLKKRNLYFKNHSYVIVYLIASEWTTVGNVGGWFDFIKDVKIYVKDKKDKKAIRSAKQAIERIRERNRSVDYSSVFTAFFGAAKPLQEFQCTQISGNVYKLERNNKPQ